jgi:hypothetical protein
MALHQTIESHVFVAFTIRPLIVWAVGKCGR